MIQNWLLKILLSPFSVLYGLVISLRNSFYDSNLLKATKFSVPVIGVGNLSIGGAGKTPHIEYLIMLLKEYIDVAVLSRGYKRKSKGFSFVEVPDSVSKSGDEPIQFKRKYRDITVAVAESRVTAIPEIMKVYPDTDCILLDDAFQHRSVLPGLNILLTEFDKPFTQDHLLPVGRLREWKTDAKRADAIVVTKCADTLSEEERQKLETEIKPLSHQKLFFSKYTYYPPYLLLDGRRRINLSSDLTIILLSAIASNEYLVSYLEGITDEVISYKFEDHHYFNERDLSTLKQGFENVENDKKIILTTEKDAVRLFEHKEFISKHKLPVFILPIAVSFMDDDGMKFDSYIKEYLLNVKY